MTLMRRNAALRCTARLRQGATALLLAATLGTAAAAPLDDLRRLVESSQFEQAVMLGQRHPELIGDVHFDFLYGIAAVSAGRVPEGLLALERHLAAVPANDRARLELARGYFLIGEYARARSEFEFVLRYNPPAAVRRNIEGFLAAMQLRDDRRRASSARVYLEAGLGHDSNVNSGTTLDEIDLIFGTVSLDGSPSQAVADGFLQLAAGAQQAWRVSPEFSVFAGADIDHREHFRERSFNQSNIAFNAGFTQLRGEALYRFTLGLGELRVDDDRYRDTFSVGGEASFTRGPQHSATAFAQYFEYRHAGADEVRDARAVTVGGTWTWGLPELKGAPQLGLRASWTVEHNSRLRDDLSRDVPLLRLFGSASPMSRLRVAGGLTLYGQKYRGRDIGFGSTRSDTAVNVDLAATYALDPRWSLRAEWSSFWNRSNQDLYDTERHTLTLKSRYQY
jgi:tetratricopeptide (TPR) repeat protein